MLASQRDVEIAPGDTSAPHPDAVRMVVVDPEPLLRWALTQIARERGGLAVVGEAGTPDDAVRVTFGLAPAVVTIGCGTAWNEGWEVVQRLRETNPMLGIVVLAADASDAMLFRALNVGASAFVPKSAPIDEVLASIRYAAASPQSFSASGLAAALRRKREVQERLALSPREQQILVLLHDGMSVPAIAAELYVSLSTAKSYVTRLYVKLGARNRAQALMTAVRLGMFEQHLPAAI